MFLDSPAPSLSFLLPASSQGISACWAAGAARERGLGTVQCTCFPLSSTCTCTFTVGEKCVDLLRALACAPKVGGGKIPEVLWDTRGCLRASDLEGARAPQGLRFPQYSRVVQNVLFDLFMFMMSVYVYDVGISFQLVGTTALFTSGCWRSHPAPAMSHASTSRGSERDFPRASSAHVVCSRSRRETRFVKF